MANWKVGDVVTLKGGGPIMTITNVDNGSKPYCQWFISGKTEGATFPAEALKESSPE